MAFGVFENDFEHVVHESWNSVDEFLFVGIEFFNVFVDVDLEVFFQHWHFLMTHLVQGKCQNVVGLLSDFVPEIEQYMYFQVANEFFVSVLQDNQHDIVVYFLGEVDVSGREAPESTVCFHRLNVVWFFETGTHFRVLVGVVQCHIVLQVVKHRHQYSQLKLFGNQLMEPRITRVIRISRKTSLQKSRLGRQLVESVSL